MAGFVFESNRGTRHIFAPESVTSVDFIGGVVLKRSASSQKSVEVSGGEIEFVVLRLTCCSCRLRFRKELYQTAGARTSLFFCNIVH